MAILFLAIAGLLILVIFFAGFRIKKRQDELNKDFLLSLEEGRLEYRLLDLHRDVAIRDPSSVGYIPLRGEKLLGYNLDAQNFDTKERGRLYITTKAVVFQSERKSDRLTWSSMRTFELKREGLEIKKARGWRKAFRCEDPNFLALAEAAYLESKS